MSPIFWDSATTKRKRNSRSLRPYFESPEDEVKLIKIVSEPQDVPLRRAGTQLRVVLEANVSGAAALTLAGHPTQETGRFADIAHSLIVG